MTTKSVELDGIRMAYSEAGRGVPMLLLHGNPDTRHSWQEILRRVAETESGRVIAPDFPGFGDSDPFPERADIGPAAMATFWNRFADAVGIEEPAVVAVHDFGGPWLLPWVARFPERVRGVLILNTLFHGDYRWHGWARVWQTPLLGEISMALLSRWGLRLEMKRGCPKITREICDATYARIHPTMKKTVLRFYREYAKPGPTFAEWEERLAGAMAGLPCRVVWGDRDPYIPSSYAERFGVPATHLPELGHWHHMVDPKATLVALAELAAG